MSDNIRYGCALLAGGSGSRMGGRNKAELEYGRQTFGDRIAAEMSGMGMPCYLSVAAYEQEVPDGWTPVKDCVTDTEGKYIGPMGGMYSCLKQACDDGLGGLFFVPCDAPLYTSEVTLKLRGYIDPGADAVLWKTADGRLQTTFGWYSVRCMAALEEDITAAGYKILRTLEKVRYKIINTTEAGLEEKLFSNINNMEDFRVMNCDCISGGFYNRSKRAEKISLWNKRWSLDTGVTEEA